MAQKDEVKKFVKISVTIEKWHKEWLNNNKQFNASALLREAIMEEINKTNSQKIIEKITNFNFNDNNSNNNNYFENFISEYNRVYAMEQIKNISKNNIDNNCSENKYTHCILTNENNLLKTPVLISNETDMPQKYQIFRYNIPIGMSVNFKSFEYALLCVDTNGYYMSGIYEILVCRYKPGLMQRKIIANGFLSEFGRGVAVYDKNNNYIMPLTNTFCRKNIYDCDVTANEGSFIEVNVELPLILRVAELDLKSASVVLMLRCKTK